MVSLWVVEGCGEIVSVGIDGGDMLFDGGSDGGDCDVGGVDVVIVCGYYVCNWG